ncbi:MAG TPA: hypothetical protein VFA79_07300 [Myxococcales bacterium]|nr:hypothetical protein [Myxococcales bacterium]
MRLDVLFDLGLAGLVFLGLCVWLVRKIVRAARTESALEEQRLEGALAEELRAARARAAASQRPNLIAVVDPKSASEAGPILDPLTGADVRGADPAHLPLIVEMVRDRELQLRAQHIGETDVARRVEVLWVRSNELHAAWCERRHAGTVAARALTRDVICVARIERGAVVERWYFR